MAYQKTAKDLAWDRERAKLRHEAEEWRMNVKIRVCGRPLPI